MTHAVRCNGTVLKDDELIVKKTIDPADLIFYHFRRLYPNIRPMVVVVSAELPRAPEISVLRERIKALVAKHPRLASLISRGGGRGNKASNTR